MMLDFQSHVWIIAQNCLDVSTEHTRGFVQSEHLAGVDDEIVF